MPLVAGMDTDIPANMQINIRKVFTYSDMIINASWVLKHIFKKKFNESVYFSERTYNSNIVFEVPSGAFFLINTDIFERVGFLMRVHFYMQKYLKANPIMIKFYQWNYCVGEKSEKIFAEICYYIKKYVHFYK